jgi:hypothetical protein
MKLEFDETIDPDCPFLSRAWNEHYRQEIAELNFELSAWLSAWQPCGKAN